MLPPLTDFVALLGIDLVLCAGLLRLLNWRRDFSQASAWSKWVGAACFVILWMPVGAAQLPLLAYVRGISSDLSITLVALAALSLGRRLLGLGALEKRERMALNGVLAATALFLYPLALGWGDWDAYRLGWGAPGLWLALLALSVFCWVRGLRLLPMVVALALLAWTAGLLESTNLWDYLLDPWLATAALFQSLKFGVRLLLTRGRGAGAALVRSGPG
ncbi:hypothetical protein SAMN05216344_103116 [Polaromonas sp. OV174]|uniref:hypothetical protein n=1 Tax=Polaromonas sp. OV174 TaxID=1855300 RepID=UPI0008EA24D8|nr:hypothetical protein [Polaromonas sp. OV174]SFB78806.1 hypothetical protein SAMN05216344_103116 [Polaromonas sp. OV174]